MRSSFIFAVAVALISSGALAQSSGGCGRASVFAKLPDAAVSQFRANPQALSATFATARLPPPPQVRSPLANDAGLIDAAKNGDAAQKAAIGAGLAQASQTLVCANRQIAATIQQKVAQSGPTPGANTAATGSGGAGPTGGVGGASCSISGSDFEANSLSAGDLASFFSGGSASSDRFADRGATATQTGSVMPAS